MWNPAITWTKKYAVFITLENEQGITGLGECWCFDTAPDVLVAYLKTEICPHVAGATIDDCADIFQRLWSRATLTSRHGLLASAWSGIDIALWDLRSRITSVPLWKLLASGNAQTPKPDGSVYLYASGGLYGEPKTLDDLAAEMASMHMAGFDIVKMKTGGLSITKDLERINAVLDSLNPSCKLIIDGVYSYTASQALELFSKLPAERIEAFQSPVPAADIEGMRSLCHEGVPVMATEAEYRSEIHEQLINTGAVKYLQTAPIACGGISRLMQLSEDVAKTTNPRVTLSLEVSSTAVALLAAAQYAAASIEVTHVEYHYLHQVFFDRLNLTQIDNQTGWFRLSEAPGLSMDILELDTRLEFSQSLN